MHNKNLIAVLIALNLVNLGLLNFEKTRLIWGVVLLFLVFLLCFCTLFLAIILITRSLEWGKTLKKSLKIKAGLAILAGLITILVIYFQGVRADEGLMVSNLEKTLASFALLNCLFFSLFFSVKLFLEKPRTLSN